MTITNNPDKPITLTAHEILLLALLCKPPQGRKPRQGREGGKASERQSHEKEKQRCS